MNKQQGYEIVKELVEKFEQNLADYENPAYNEAQVRVEFINPFFEALGWDMTNKQGLGFHYTEIVHEYVEKRHRKRPDYLFRQEQNKNFFYVETKKPSIYLLIDPEAAQQVRNYGRMSKLRISLLSNFKEFAIYSCTSKVYDDDQAKVGRILYLTYKDYLKHFDFLWETFGRDNVWAGSLQAYAKKQKDINDKDSIDTDFLHTIEEWRKDLAVNIHTQNPQLDEAQLNTAVQQTIDRILFLKIAEDRSIEPANQLKELGRQGKIYIQAFSVFQEADQRYNSGLFDFKKDTVSEKLKIDNKILKNIIKTLYGRNSFDFSVIPVEILGYAYEQFLGKVITINTNGSANVELKPDVRKAGGVYYTPQYVVDYIVEQTLGKKIKEIEARVPHTDIPKEIEKLKIVDPSCGSGSFLLGAYQYLLDYHLKYYTDFWAGKTNKKERDKYLNHYGLLANQVKKNILVNNIFGVDIDHQAVEVAKLSLLIKCLEGETSASIAEINKMFKQHALPSLDANILCGNSLVSYDFYTKGLFLTSKEQRAINTFDWKSGFKAVFQNQKGFDLVIGNPPYISTKRGFSENKNIAEYYKNHYQTAIGQYDAYMLFIEKVFMISLPTASWGMIIPKPILTNQNMEVLRGTILKNGSITHIADFGTPFKDANVEAVVICQSRTILPNDVQIDFFSFDNEKNKAEKKATHFIPQSVFVDAPFKSFLIKSDSNTESVLQNIEKDKMPFRYFVKSFMRGVEAGKKDTTIHTKNPKNQYKKLLRGEDVIRYKHQFSDFFIEIDEKDKAKFKDKSVYECPKKIIIRRVGSDLQATLDTENHWNLNTIYNIQLNNNIYEYILGIFNSKLVSFWFKNRFVFEDKLFPYARVSQLEQIPIPVLDLTTKKDKDFFDTITFYVETLLDLYSQNPLTSHEKDQLTRRIDYTEEELNKTIYALYNLSQTEIDLIESI
jgi:hypothetical protein